MATHGGIHLDIRVFPLVIIDEGKSPETAPHLDADAVGDEIHGPSLIYPLWNDFIFYLTPAEHLGLPLKEDVHTSVITTRMAVHIADVACGQGVINRENEIARARVAMDVDRQIRTALAPDKFIAATKVNSHWKQLGVSCSADCAVHVAAEHFGIAEVNKKPIF